MNGVVVYGQKCENSMSNMSLKHPKEIKTNIYGRIERILNSFKHSLDISVLIIILPYKML